MKPPAILVDGVVRLVMEDAFRFDYFIDLIVQNPDFVIKVGHQDGMGDAQVFVL